MGRWVSVGGGDAPINTRALNFFQDYEKIVLFTLPLLRCDFSLDRCMAVRRGFNTSFIFPMPSLISESLQILYFPFSPQANGALKPHQVFISLPVAKCCHIYHLVLESLLSHSWAR